VPIVLGIGLIAYSLFTNYELGVWKVAPMAVHNLIDIAAGIVHRAAHGCRLTRSERAVASVRRALNACSGSTDCDLSLTSRRTWACRIRR
jgi:hypothetical protein